MIKHLCRALLTAAARRWPQDVREEMLAEWRAELHAMPGTARRLRFAGSLATSRPHREPAVVVRPGRTFAHTVLSLVLVAVLPMLYVQLSLQWTTFYDEYSIVWQAWAGAGGMVGAVLLGIICAGVTTGVTQLIRPALVPLWIFGILFVVVTAWPLLEGYAFNRSHAGDGLRLALSASLLCTLAGRFSRASWSWGVVAIAVPISYWAMVTRFDPYGMELFFDGRTLPAYLFMFVTQASIHVTIFLLVYANLLVRRHRARQARLLPQAAPA
ncbi:hypothetical protein Cs7R123_45570 [Catellatospora sp. TT07R-123]|uniref:hypothetical protein n=1 Tax=Catellatospora sp. TT07R-123 TaxID=2733863 RepID=UPI001B0DBBC4|nr:hypothetical protein [Catellatospora sp. TT07R-123]GHJ47215.1 hypothetical protein Cs7R123_45570 [Catellatospora sp. TT07R-123]